MDLRSARLRNTTSSVQGRVYAVAFSRGCRRIVSQDVMPLISSPEIPESNVCDRCKSENSIVKAWLCHNKSGDVQTYRCKECKHKFIINTGFEKIFALTPESRYCILDLYFKGVSLRKIFVTIFANSDSVKITLRFSDKLVTQIRRCCKAIL